MANMANTIPKVIGYSKENFIRKADLLNFLEGKARGQRLYFFPSRKDNINLSKYIFLEETTIAIPDCLQNKVLIVVSLTAPLEI
jgi:hypothetical protein